MSKLSDKPWENAGSSVGKEPACNAGDAGDEYSITGSGRSPGGEHGNPLQYSCLENPMDRGAWWATVQGVTKSQTGLKWSSTRAWKMSKAWEWVLASCEMVLKDEWDLSRKIAGKEQKEKYVQKRKGKVIGFPICEKCSKSTDKLR